MFHHSFCIKDGHIQCAGAFVCTAVSCLQLFISVSSRLKLKKMSAFLVKVDTFSFIHTMVSLARFTPSDQCAGGHFKNHPTIKQMLCPKDAHFCQVNTATL